MRESNNQWLDVLDMARHHRRVIVVAVAFVVASLMVSFGLSLRSLGPPETWHPREPGLLPRAVGLPFVFLAYAYVVTVPAALLGCVLLAISLVKARLWWLSIVAFSLMELIWLPAAWFASIVPLD